MEQLPKFIACHWLLVSAFLVVLITLLILETRSKGSSSFHLSQQQVVRLINNAKATIVDIREPNTYSQGYITSAINISSTELNKCPQCLEQYKQQPIILVCTTGKKSKLLRYKFYRKGYKKIYSMIGGMNAWKNNGMPIVKK